jgi:hypothetical protein
MRRRPELSEFFEYYCGYVSLVPEGDIVSILRAQAGESIAYLERVPADKVAYRYAPGKWSLGEVVAHVADIEWVFLARALHFARKVEGALPGVEQDDMIAASNAGARPLSSLLAQWKHLREAGALFFESLDDEAWGRTGIASGRSFTVRTIPYIIAGHERHHLNVIREKYLGQ